MRSPRPIKVNLGFRLSFGGHIKNNVRDSPSLSFGNSGGDKIIALAELGIKIYDVRIWFSRFEICCIVSLWNVHQNQ
jgi:hypothetical protein